MLPVGSAFLARHTLAMLDEPRATAADNDLFVQNPKQLALPSAHRLFGLAEPPSAHRLFGLAERLRRIGQRVSS
jgi:hypothetical protein